MNPMEYRNQKRFLVLGVFVLYSAGSIPALIASYTASTPKPMNVAVLLLGLLMVGLIAAYVMTQCVRIGPHSVSQGSCLGVNEMPYRSIERIELETQLARGGRIQLMKLWSREGKLVLTSAVEGFDAFSNEVLARSPQAAVQDRRWRP